jgi:D-methionine transport system substrate-binding protein
MKKILSIILLMVVMAIATACGTANGGEDDNTIRIGATPTPHVEVLEEAKPLLEEKGFELEITEMNDYVTPNKALATGDLDANYFQHIPYLNQQMSENDDFDFVNAGGVHIEPIGVYSQRYESLEDLPDGATILMSNSVADHGRMLSLLESVGIVSLKEGVDKTAATIEDVVENPKNLEFRANVEAAMLPKAYENDEADAILINTNYALQANLNPMEDAIALEGKESPYVNIITVNEGDEDSEKIKALVEVLQSEEIQNFIKEKYKGAVVPVGN